MCVYLGDDVDATQQQLVEVSVLHHLRAVDDHVLKTRPYLPTQLRGHVQLHTQVPQTHAGKVVHLAHTQNEIKVVHLKGHIIIL